MRPYAKGRRQRATKTIRFRCTPAEHEAITRAADRSKMDVSGLILYALSRLKVVPNPLPSPPGKGEDDIERWLSQEAVR